VGAAALCALLLCACAGSPTSGSLLDELGGLGAGGALLTTAELAAGLKGTIELPRKVASAR
jgi:hypothetical protein